MNGLDSRTAAGCVECNRGIRLVPTRGIREWTDGRCCQRSTLIDTNHERFRVFAVPRNVHGQVTHSGRSFRSYGHRRWITAVDGRRGLGSGE